MKTESINNLLKAKFGEQNSYSKDQLAQVTNLTIQRFDIAGNVSEVFVNELELFPNLEEVMIQQCVIDDEFIHYLCGLSKLKSLSLLYCDLDGNFSNLLNIPTLKDICLDGTDVPISLFQNGMYDTLILSNIEISDNVTFYVNKLDIRKATITNWNFLSNKIDTLIVSNTQYHTFEELKNYSHYLLVMDDDDPETVLEEVNA